jgi:hypothetical protein
MSDKFLVSSSVRSAIRPGLAVISILLVGRPPDFRKGSTAAALPLRLSNRRGGGLSRKKVSRPINVFIRVVTEQFASCKTMAKVCEHHE